MKYLVFSDVHADEAGLQALQASPAFKDCQKIFLGDSFMAQDTATLGFFDKVKSVSDLMILGNHEAVYIDRCTPALFNPKWREPIEKAKPEVQAHQSVLLDELRGLEQQYATAEAAFAHGSFDPDNPWGRVRYIEDLESERPHLPKKINFLAHSHIPFIARYEDGLWYYERQIYDKPFTLKDDLTYIINTGSLLGSREMRQFEKTYLVYDEDSRTVQFFNVAET